MAELLCGLGASAVHCPPAAMIYCFPGALRSWLASYSTCSLTSLLKEVPKQWGNTAKQISTVNFAVHGYKKSFTILFFFPHRCPQATRLAATHHAICSLCINKSISFSKGSKWSCQDAPQAVIYTCLHCGRAHALADAPLFSFNKLHSICG